MVPEGPVHRYGAPADHVRSRHDLGGPSPRQASRQTEVGHFRTVQLVVPSAHYACRGVGVIFSLVPSLVGAPIGTIIMLQPDFGLALVASAVTGVLWAVFRLVVAYTGKSRTA